MLWPFNRPKNPAAPSRPTIEAIYGMIVAQARLPIFYERYGAPDTVNGRFDMVLLHLWMVLRRLKATPDAAPLSQALVDRFCSDMDANLRELGVSDLAVPRRIRGFAEAFYGRAGAYDAAMQAGQTLAPALVRNVLIGADVAAAEPLADYARTILRQLDAVDDSRLLTGAWSFPPPDVLSPQDTVP